MANACCRGCQAVTLSGELFRRSAAFRRLVAAQTSQFYARLLSAAGEDGEAHGTAANRVRSPSRSPQQSPQLATVLALIEKWKEDFGARYLPLVTGYDVLVTRGYEFPRVRETRAAEQQRAQQTQTHRDRVRELKARQRQREMAQMVPEMETLLSEMHQVFEVLIPTLDAFQLPEVKGSPATEGGASEAAAPPSSAVNAVATGDEHATEASRSVPAAEDDDDADDDIEWESVDPDDAAAAQQDPFGDNDEDLERDGMPHEDMDMNEIVAAYGLGSASYQLTIEISTSVCERSADNEVLFRSLADGILRLRKRFLPLVRDWIESTRGPDQAEASRGDEGEIGVWRQLQDLHARLHDVELKWEDLVRESERKRFARLAPAVVTVPADAYEPQLPDGPRKRRV